MEHDEVLAALKEEFPGLAEQPPPLTEGVADEFVLRPGVMQVGIDDVTLVAEVTSSHVENVKRHVDGAPRNRWGAYMLGQDSGFGKWESLFDRHRVFFKPDSGRLYVQAKLAPPGRLLPPTLVPQAVGVLDTVLAYYGVVVEKPWEVGRIDVAVDVAMETATDGKLLLDALRAVRLPRGWYGESAGPKTPTVYHRLPKGKVGARNYSRHRETGAGPYEVVRMERQVWVSPRRPLEDYSPELVKSIWTDHYLALVPRSGKVEVGTQEEIVMKLARRVEDGEIAFGKYEQAVGYLLAEKLGLAESLYPSKRLQERRRLVRELGVELEAVGVDSLEVEIGELLADAAASDRWSG